MEAVSDLIKHDLFQTVVVSLLRMHQLDLNESHGEKAR